MIICTCFYPSFIKRNTHMSWPLGSFWNSLRRHLWESWGSSSMVKTIEKHLLIYDSSLFILHFSTVVYGWMVEPSQSDDRGVFYQLDCSLIIPPQQKLQPCVCFAASLALGVSRMDEFVLRKSRSVTVSSCSVALIFTIWPWDYDSI